MAEASVSESGGRGTVIARGAAPTAGSPMRDGDNTLENTAGSETLTESLSMIEPMPRYDNYARRHNTKPSSPSSVFPASQSYCHRVSS